MGKDFRFEIERVYQQEAERLLHAWSQARILHKSGDIDASGDEFETPVRDLFRRRLPTKYYLAHGHVVDKGLHVSPQLDVIVADNSATPILLEGENGTQYFPYESVYLIGEVKSTYRKAEKHVSRFADVLGKVKTGLERKPTPGNYIGHGVSLGKGLSTGRKETHLNPLFAFMLFADSGDIDPDSLAQELAALPDLYLPNMVCFLDGCVLVKAGLVSDGGEYRLGSLDMNCHSLLTRDDVYWTLLRFTDRQGRNGQALAVLMLGVFGHLQSCLLMEPPVTDYLQHVIQAAPHSSDIADIRALARIAADEGVTPDVKLRRALKQKRDIEDALDPVNGKRRAVLP